MPLNSIFDSNSAAPSPESGPVQSIFSGSTEAGKPVSSIFDKPEESSMSPWDLLNPFKLVGNAVGEVKSMVQGVSSIFGMGFHDLAEGVKNIIPGQQAGENEGYKLDDVVAALPSALVGDYNERYGISKFLHGDILGGLRSIVTGLYEHPLAAIGDALLVGGAVGQGARLGAKAGILSGETAAKITGGTLDEAGNLLRGTKEVASMTRGAEAAEGPFTVYTLSRNPVARLAQNKMYKLASYDASLGGRLGSAEQYVSQLGGLDFQAARRARVALDIAKAANVPVLRPVASKFLEGHSTSMLASVFGIGTKDRWVPASQQVEKVAKALKDSGVENYDDLLGYMRGTDYAFDVPSNAPVNLTTSLEAEVSNVPVVATAALDPAAFKSLATKYGKKYHEVGGYFRDNVRISPHDMSPATENRITFLVADMSDPGAIGRQVAKDMGGEVSWAKNYFRDANALGDYDGYHVGVQVGDTMYDVNIATPELAESQSMWSRLVKLGKAKEDEITSYDATIKQISEDAFQSGKPEPIAQINKLIEAQIRAEDELEALGVMNANTFDFQRRWMTAGGSYDPVAMAGDQLRPIVFNNATWPELLKGTLTARKALSRAFGPQRLAKWSTYLNNFEGRLTDILDNADAQGLKYEAIIPDVYKAAEEVLGPGHPSVEGIFRSKVDDILRIQTEDDLVATLKPILGGQPEKTILGDASWVPRGASNEEIARKIVDKIRMETHESVIVNGEFNGFTWKQLLAENEGAGLPMPQYYPDIKVSKLGSAENVQMSNRASRVVESTGGNRLKKWGGWNYETGASERDIVRAYTSVFREVSKRTEFRDFMESLVTKYGRPVSQEELAMRAGGLGGAEVLVSRKGLTNFVSADEMLLTGTHEGIRRGLSIEQATKESFEALVTKAMDDFNAGVVDEVWALPTHVAKHIDRAAKLTFGKTFNFYYDTAMNMWKASVLSLSPRWVVNNTLGNISYMAIHAPGAIRYFIEQMMPSRRAYARSILGEEFSGQIERDFIHGALGDPSERLRIRGEDANVQWTSRLADWGETPGKLQKGSSMVRTFSRGMRKVNAWIEDAARRGVAVDRLRIMGNLGAWKSSMSVLENAAYKGISPEAYPSIIKEVNKTLGDYLVMSPVEAQIIRRYVAPFYAFYRHTAKFIARMPFEHPLKAKILMQIDELDKQMNPMPDYMRGAAEIFPGQFLDFGRANPMNAVTQGYLPSISHPLLSLAVQRLTGTNPFGQPWTPPPGTLVETFGGEKYAILRGPNGEYLGVKALGDQAWEPPLWQSVMSMVPQFGLLPNMDVFGRGEVRKILGIAGIPYKGFDVQRWQTGQMRAQAEAYGLGADAAARYGG